MALGNLAVWSLTSALLFSDLSPTYSSASFPTDGKVAWRPVKGLIRTRREACEYGTYNLEGRTCCLCGAGLYLLSPCNDKEPSRCMPCESNTYRSDPNSEQQCEPCRSCDQDNVNLKVAENCTSVRNTICRCKKNHYCSSGIDICRLCHPCEECGPEGIKVACTSTSNTVCNGKTLGGNDMIRLGIIIPLTIVSIIIIIIAAVHWKIRKSRTGRQTVAQTPENPADEELQPLDDLERHLPEIAIELGWRDMQDIALRSGIPRTTIEACQLDNQGDAEQQTLKLLGRWMEMEGRDASKNLIKILRNSKKKRKAEKVMEILRAGSANGSDTPV